MDSQQKAAISLRPGTKHLLSQMGVIHTQSPGEMKGPLRGERASFSGSKTVSVLCEQWRPSSVLAALISQPVQAGAKLIWERSMRGQGTHRRREVMRSRWVYTLGLIQCVALASLKVEQRHSDFTAMCQMFLQKLTYSKQEITEESYPAIIRGQADKHRTLSSKTPCVFQF